VVDGMDVLEELGVDDTIVKATVIAGGENLKAHARSENPWADLTKLLIWPNF
jgi:hypothetical protein